MSKAKQKRVKIGKEKISFKQWAAQHKKPFTIVAIAILVVEVFFVQYSRYAYNVIKCGGLPVVSEPNELYGGTAGYNFPGSSDYRARAWSTYYCTKEDAENKGIAPNTLSEGGLERERELKAQGNWPPRRKE